MKCLDKIRSVGPVHSVFKVNWDWEGELINFYSIGEAWVCRRGRRRK